MLHEAEFWREEISSNRASLAKIAKQQMHGRKTKVTIEKNVFLTFYAIRKLIENGHLPPETAEHQISVRTHLRRPDVPWSHGLSLDRLYDTDRSSVQQSSVRYVMNQFIHSAVFVIQLRRPMEIIGFHVASDRERDRQCLYVSLAEVLDIFDLAGSPASQATGGPTTT